MGDRPGPVVVTGANSGIGLASVLRFASHGWETWGTVRSDAKADILADAAEQAGVADVVRPVVLDVSDADAVVERWPVLPDFYAVVNNAGMNVSGPIEDVPESAAKALLDINLVTPAVIASCALPGMRARGSGRIVNVSSIAGLQAILPFHGWYHASKFALEALSDVLRLEVASFGVSVVLIEPGFHSTSILGKASGQLQAHVDLDSPYATAMDRTRSVTALVDRVAPPPRAVARAIASALESRRPRRRYLVGRETLPIRGLGLVPDQVTDRVVRMVANLDS